MTIIGFSFSGIDAKKFDIRADKAININSTPKITEVKEITLSNLKKKGLSMNFEFLTTYEPKIGEIKVNGNLILLADKNEAVLEQWKKDKSLPQGVSVEVLNHLFKRCLLKATNISDDLQLPPPLTFPLIKPKEKKEEQPSYVG